MLEEKSWPHVLDESILVFCMIDSFEFKTTDQQGPTCEGVPLLCWWVLLEAGTE